jgi:hypothetical protein
VKYISRTSPPTPLLAKERGDKAQLYRGEVIAVPQLLRKRYNVSEASVTDRMEQDLQKQNAELAKLHIDRADLSSNLVKNRNEQLQIYCNIMSAKLLIICHCERNEVKGSNHKDSGIASLRSQ